MVSDYNKITHITYLNLILQQTRNQNLKLTTCKNQVKPETHIILFLGFASGNSIFNPTSC